MLSQIVTLVPETLRLHTCNQILAALSLAQPYESIDESDAHIILIDAHRERMRLLNAWTLQVEEFSERNTPPYAILSHTWGDQEILLHDIQSGNAQSLKGFSKVEGCCKQAQNDGLQYVVSCVPAQIDTCIHIIFSGSMRVA